MPVARARPARQAGGTYLWSAAMSAVLNVALPVFAIILAGVLLARFKLLGAAASEALNRFVYLLALPAVLFLGTARAPLADILNGPFLGAFLGAMLVVYAGGALLGRLIHREDASVTCMQGLSASFSNTGYMGIPLFLAAFGADRLAPAILATVVMSVVMVGIAVIWLEIAGSRGRGLAGAVADVARALATNPLILSSAAGMGWSLAFGGALLPKPVVTFCELVGGSAGPCALFAIGLFLGGRRLSAKLGEVAWISALKLVAQPLLTWLLIEVAFPLDPYWAASALILAALPTGGLTFVVAQRYQVYVERTSAVILVSTVLSMATLSLLLAFYVPAHP